MTANPSTTRKLSRAAYLILGVLAIACSVVSFNLSGWTATRVSEDWWAVASTCGITLGTTAVLCAAYNYWCEVPRNSRRSFAISGIGSVLALLVVVGVTARVVIDPRVDLGSLPAWISAGGALFTAGGVILALHSYRSTRQADLEDQANQVRLLQVAALPAGTENGKQRWRTEFVNKSDGPLYQIKVHGFRASAVKSKPAVPMRAIDLIYSEDDPRRHHPIKVSGLAFYAELPVGGRVRTLWEADEMANATAPPRRYTTIWYSVLDQNGRSWNVADNYEPKKISRPDRPIL
ncbi:hypothetical protein RhoFasSB10_03658 [Rhodococcus fascians]|nr:hypothetical protein [Rhodococcus fascians]